ncbi:MAG: 30S ribosomal protein S9 [Crocinitomicaceae bacterium]|jgi:small subunit ribosomal protein S9|nr:30S ribosomal protein S9 [Crocinitomicaceae bacterium]MBK6951213.1 30S ribosomal protein S9 [Crocinitomicaceae bacterium]MBK9590583.1 30S ribosomal protein S9 [Crocinitomicaceae bacterium]
MSVTNTLGRRKTAVARVYLSKGSGKVTVNEREVKDYFKTPVLLDKVNQPFQLTSTLGQYDVNVNVDGGGVNGQAEAVRLGISRALVEINPDFKTLLKAEGLMTRDPRMVERKKPGRKKARKRFQFSKR